MMKLLILVYLIPTILSAPSRDRVNVYSDKDCWTNNNQTITKQYATLVNFSPLFKSESETCSVHISNPWATEMANGFGVFLNQRMDCSSTVTIDCPPGSTLMSTTPAAVQYTCHTGFSSMEMPCSSIRLTYKRNPSIQGTKEPTHIQVIALAKEPCVDRDILFQCSKDYPSSCLDRKLQCNGRSECPSGEDERFCHKPPAAGLPILVIVLVVLAFLFVICIISTVLICCCCRAACQMILLRIRPAKKNKSVEKGNIVIATGEDAGLMKGLTTTNVIEILPQHNFEPGPLVIDSTKPVYPRLE